MRGDGLNLEPLKVARVEMIFFPKVGSKHMMVVSDHILIDLREANVESTMMDYLRSEVLKMILHLIVGPEVVRMIETIEPLRIYLVKFLTLLQLLYFPGLNNANDLLMLILPR